MRPLLAFSIALAALLSGALAFAHAVGLSNGEYERTPGGLRAEMVFAHSDLIAALPELDRNRDGSVDGTELSESRARLHQFAAEALVVRAGSERCRLLETLPRLTDAMGLSLSSSFECPRVDAALSIELRFLNELGREHRHRAKVVGGAERLVFGGDARLELPALGSASDAHSSYTEYVRLGFGHILSGLDHIAFLLALLLSVRRIKTLLAVVSAFTLAHSLSLALVTLGAWAPSPRYVEPAIALSIVYVALEGATGRMPTRPALVSFAFGLVHGMGFAGALGELNLTPSEIPVALVLFNAGVELGQLLLLFALVPSLRWLTKYGWFQRRVLPLCSVALAVCGVFWFAARVG
ncbi:MAG TPA: HupE/UreJ family protein [Polyangiaceae bacterium]|nr:HupE/UreJ family protein [Polyangiaceae bacterium]